jgi:hypothetical protein
MDKTVNPEDVIFLEELPIENFMVLEKWLLKNVSIEYSLVLS